MKEDGRVPQIDSAKIRVGGGIAGAIFTAGTMLIFLLGIPVLRYVFPASIILGGAVALIIHFKRHETPGKSWLLPATEQSPEPAPKPERDPHRERSTRTLLPNPTC